MKSYEMIKIGKDRKLMERAAQWFHRKWGLPKEAYLESMEACVVRKKQRIQEATESPIPQWYVVLKGQKIIAGIGVIENDFHERKDLAPNICALYVEEAYRNQGIAGKLLKAVCAEYYAAGINPLYLITDHTAFYERYGWEFLCMVREESDDGAMMRMYIYDGDKRENDFMG